MVLLLAVTAVAAGQPIKFGFDRAPRAELSPPQVDVVSGPTSSRLEQARALAKDKNWEDAIEIFQQLSADNSDQVVEVADRRYVSLRAYCHLQLVQLPKEALAIYRRRVDALAERWFGDGLDGRNEDALRRVVDELFCSSWSDDALFALGELALERADYAAARRYWEQISPLLRDPAGRPLWLALRNVNLDANWPQVAARWQTREPATWLAYPDTDLNLADVRARVILASIRAGELQRAKFELNVFQRFHPDAAGRLGGQESAYVATLETLLESARQWPAEPLDRNWLTFAGSQSRVPASEKLGPITGPAWAKPVTLSPTVVQRTVRTSRLFGGEFGGGLVQQPPDVPIRESQRPLSFFPVAAHGTVFYSDATQLHAVDLQTGRPAVTRNGVLHRDDDSDSRRSDVMNHFGGGVWRPDFGISGGGPRHTLTIAEDVLYGRVGGLATSHARLQGNAPRDRIVGLNVERDAALAFREQPEDASWSFDGVPVGKGGRIWVAMRRSDVAPHSYVACFDAATGNMVWRTKTGAADMLGSGVGNVVTHNLLTLVSDRIYFNTNLGLIAALDAFSGEICWLHRYERSGGEYMPGRSRSLHIDRDPSPCLVHEGVVIVAPADTPRVLALDADTGQTIWATDKLPDALHLLGVVRNNLIVSGNRLWALDLQTGKARFVWPESEHAGIRGMGRGLVAGDEVYWSTRKEIYVIHGVTGGQSRQPIPLGAVSDSGANLAAASGRLIVAGYDKLMVFGPALPMPPNQRKPKTEPIATSAAPTPPTGRLSDQSKNRN